MAEVRTRSSGKWILGPGTMYRTLKQMTVDGLIEHLPSDQAAGGDETRRQYYTLTERGRRVAAGEARRMSRLVERARGGSLISRTESP